MAVPVNEPLGAAPPGFPVGLAPASDERADRRSGLAREMLHWLILVRAWRRVLEAETDPRETRTDRDQLLAVLERLNAAVNAARSAGLVSAIEARQLTRADEHAKATAEKLLVRDAETEDAA